MAKSTTTTSYFDPESTSGKTADFAHWQAEFTRAFADFDEKMADHFRFVERARDRPVKFVRIR